MAMTRKDYEATAAILADRSLHLGEMKRAALASRFADLYAKDNARFDRDKFLRAANVPEFCIRKTP